LSTVTALSTDLGGPLLSNRQGPYRVSREDPGDHEFVHETGAARTR
jgi:hypothetical protein